MDEDNFWNRLYQIAEKLKVQDAADTDAGMDKILSELGACYPEMRADMRKTLALVIGRLAILQTMLPPSI